MIEVHRRKLHGRSRLPWEAGTFSFLQRLSRSLAVSRCSPKLLQYFLTAAFCCLGAPFETAWLLFFNRKWNWKLLSSGCISHLCSKFQTEQHVIFCSLRILLFCSLINVNCVYILHLAFFHAVSIIKPLAILDHQSCITSNSLTNSVVKISYYSSR